MTNDGGYHLPECCICLYIYAKQISCKRIVPFENCSIYLIGKYIYKHLCPTFSSIRKNLFQYEIGWIYVTILCIYSH